MIYQIDMKNAYEVRGNITAIFIKYKSEIIETIIDTQDIEIANSFPGTWFGAWYKGVNGLYVFGNKYIGDRKSSPLLLHRHLFNSPKGFRIDHINHNTLDNRRSLNLSEVLAFENSQNRSGLDASNTSGYRGVTWDKSRGKWKAFLGCRGKYICLGRFEDIEEANKAAVQGRKRYMPYLNNQKARSKNES